MLKTLTSKFTFFFWLVFFAITIPVYIFGTLYIKDILQDTEHEKVQLMVGILKPTIALNLSFEQKKQIDKILQTILDEKNIIEVKLSSKNFNQFITKNTPHRFKLLHYKDTIRDPFDKKQIATIEVVYSNENFLLIYNKITKVILFIMLFALLVFLSFYLFIKKELNTLRYIANSFKQYSETKQMEPIFIKNNTHEISTIASTANEMMQNISQYLQELQTFNIQLEHQVEEKVQELQLQEKMMIHQSRQAAMGEMLESIAHQWRQPLNIIGLSCANLETEYQLGLMNAKNFQEKMKIISTNINYMSSTIDDFRNFLNPDRDLSYFNPTNTIEDVLQILNAQLSNNTIKITINMLQYIELYGIENEFKQVVFILLNNAKDAIKSAIQEKKIPHGDITVTIGIHDTYNTISFCDNGGGIKEEIMDSIFNPYFSTKFASSGTGIGLYIAKNIIESRMKGKLSVKNTTKGCCFTIEQKKEIK